MYRRGEAEQVVGRALKGIDRDDYVLATKVYFQMGDGPERPRPLAQAHHGAVRALARRLGVDYVDLYQCHRPDPETPLEETLRALDDLVTQGKVLYVGVSEWPAELLDEARQPPGRAGLRPLRSNQPQYSMLYRAIEAEVVPLSKQLGIGQIVWSPMAQGVLTGKYQPGDEPPEDSRAAGPDGGFMQPFMEDRVLEARAAAAADRRRRWGSRWPSWRSRGCCARRTCRARSSGASRPEQVDDNVAASGVELGDGRAGGDRPRPRGRRPGIVRGMATEEKTQEEQATGVHGGRLVAKRLKAHGVTKLFTLSGGHLFSIYDGCREEGIDIVDTRHEQSAAFAAEGWAKATRQPGVAALTAGPGVTNGMSPMGSALMNGSPMVVLGGRAPAMRWGQGSLQEIDHVPFVEPLTRFARTAESTADIPGLRRRGASRPPPGRPPGPTFVDFSLDHVFMESDVDADAPAELLDHRALPAAEGVEQAIELLKGAERPAIMAGTGLYFAHGEDASRRSPRSSGSPCS